MNRLDLKRLPAAKETLARGETSTSPRFDHVALRVDGADLRQVLGQVQEGGRVGLPADVALESRHLRGQPDPALTFESKPAILVCGQCADRYCGMTIMRVTFEGAEVRWSEFEDVWFDGASGEWDCERLDAGPFIFDVAGYEQALSPVIL